MSLLLLVLTAVFTAETHWTVSPKPLTSVVAENQFRTISEAVDKAEPGDTIEIHTGIYREKVTIPATKSGTLERPLRLVAAPTAEVVLTGSDVLTQWTPEPELGDGIVSTDWQDRFGGPHPNDLRHQTIGRTEQVFVDRYPLKQVFELRQLAPGTFYVDLDKGRLYLRDAKNTESAKYSGLHVEVATRTRILQVKADHVHIKGLRLRHSANIAQLGMASFHGANVLIEDCVFEQSSATGVRFAGTDAVVRRCRFLHNGFDAFEANEAHGLRFEECLVANNNTKDFNRDWGAVNKIALSRNVVIDHCVFRDNHGCGLWFDIGNENCVVKNSLFLNNEDHGLFYEIGYTMHAHDNVFIGNGIGPGHPYWGNGSGIFISDSMGCIVERNLAIGNGGAGFTYREQKRTTERLDTRETSPDKDPLNWFHAVDANYRDYPEYWIWNRGHIVRNNIFAYNESAQLNGWFAVHDARHWPQARQREMVPTQSEDILLADAVTAPYLAKTGEEPVGRCLENLELRHENNFFARRDGQRLFVWGGLGFKHVEYDDFAKVSEELLGLEKGSLEGSIVFRDYHVLDLRIPADSEAIKMDCYPRGDVPLVRLGTIPTP
jgi:hypothetical protein